MPEKDTTPTAEQREAVGDQGSPEDAPQPDVEPTDEGTVGEQVPGPATAEGFNPDLPVATSPPPPDAQSGEVVLDDEQTSGTFHPEGSATDPAVSEARQADEDEDEDEEDDEG